MSIDKRYVFPAVLLLINLGAAVVSFKAGDWKRGAYWLGSAVCIATVAFT
ncbi:MAG TPA: hypothetical protein VFC37_11155 [Terracidiphilus sp.]|nr:hypothetical protein [Terracidiphilus sp.]